MFVIDMNEITKDLIVLDAINNGIKQFDKIVKVTKIQPRELNNILKKLKLKKRMLNGKLKSNKKKEIKDV